MKNTRKMGIQETLGNERSRDRADSRRQIEQLQQGDEQIKQLAYIASALSHQIKQNEQIIDLLTMIRDKG